MGVSIPETESLSDGQIESAEAQLGSRLPSAYREFARRHDGAVPQSNTFDVPGNQSGVRRFVSLLDAAALRREVEGFPIQGVAIAEDDCGNYVWLDPQSGAVFFWDHEVDQPSVRIAEDFGGFVASLQPFDPASVRLAPGQVQKIWVDPGFRPEFD